MNEQKIIVTTEDLEFQKWAETRTIEELETIIGYLQAILEVKCINI